MIVGLVVECCCRGRKISIFIDARLILPTDKYLAVNRVGVLRIVPHYLVFFLLAAKLVR